MLFIVATALAVINPFDPFRILFREMILPIGSRAVRAAEANIEASRFGKDAYEVSRIGGAH
jgi:hypothetical protein